MASFIKIEDVRDIPATDIKRAGKMDKQIVYIVDMARRYVINMPAEDYTPEKAMERIRVDEKERLNLLGKTFTVD